MMVSAGWERPENRGPNNAIDQGMKLETVQLRHPCLSHVLYIVNIPVSVG